MNIPYNIYQKKLSACYLGKAIGGTLGMPFEGKTGINTVEYYTPVPTEMCGNDDLDLQVMWIETLLRSGFPVNRHHLTKAWKHLNFGPDEYSVAIFNHRNGIYAPLSGAFGNKFCNGMGAAIRSEVWASIAPGNPELAVRLAIEDACVDHSGSGISACKFLAAIESSAYIESDTQKLINIGLSFIKEDIRFSSAIRDTVSWWNELGDLFEVREKILEKYPSDNWTDVTINVSFIILAWLAGNGDFGKSICFATNCGYDADCTAATLGALLGTLNPDGIEQKWIDPIGSSLVLSSQILGLRTSDSIEGLCKKITALLKCSNDYYNPSVKVCDIPDYICETASKIPVWCQNPDVINFGSAPERESLINLTPLTVNLIYPENIALIKNQKAQFSAIISNPTNSNAQIELKLFVPNGFNVIGDKFSFELEPFGSHSITFELENQRSYKSAFDFLDMIFTVNGLSFTASAGIICSYPWIIKDGWSDSHKDASLKNAVPCPAPSFINKISSGKKTLAIEVRPAMKQQVAFTCQGTRSLKLWLNGENILNYDGEFYVPALHRGRSVLADLNREWNRVIIELEDGDDGEVFLSIGNPIDWIWLNTLEWREPQV